MNLQIALEIAALMVALFLFAEQVIGIVYFILRMKIENEIERSATHGKVFHE